MTLTTLSGASRDGGLAHPPWLDTQPRRNVWSLNVLLVDDDAADTSLILSVLRRHPNVSAAHAIDAPEAALRHLATGHSHPDLVLLDIRMPRIDGFEFLERLRDIPDMDSVPVVFLTTSGLARDVLEAKESSASLYVLKPDTFPELQTRLDAVIRRAMHGSWSK